MQSTKNKEDPQFDPDEKEDDEGISPLEFSLNEINIKTEQQSGHFLLDMLEHDEINLNTPFQRSADLWSNTLMSRFIESMMLKFPIPPFYFNISHREDDETKPYWEVIDGLQRLSAIRNFYFGGIDGKKLVLKGLDFFPDLEGLTIDKLPRQLKRNIEACQITLFEVFPNTPKVVKYRIFERVNTGGLRLNEQEIRHALNQGPAVKLLERAVEIGLINNNIHIEPGRMKDQELTLRYFAFRLLHDSDYNGSMKDFLDSAMEKLSRLHHREATHLIDEFSEVVAFIQEVFGPLAFRKDTQRGINKALFDSYTFAARELGAHERQVLRENRRAVQHAYRDSLTDEGYAKSITYATARVENISKRFRMARHILNSSQYDQ